MTRRGWSVIAVAAAVLATTPAAAVDPQAIERRVGDAISLFEAEGAGALCAAVNDPSGRLLIDEAYVFVLLRDGRLICHPRPDLNEMRRDRSHVPEMLRNAEAQPRGAWTHYPWPHPETLKMGVKSTFCRITARLVVCAGAHLDAGSS